MERNRISIGDTVNIESLDSKKIVYGIVLEMPGNGSNTWIIRDSTYDYAMPKIVYVSGPCVVSRKLEDIDE